MYTKAKLHSSEEDHRLEARAAGSWDAFRQVERSVRWN